MYKFCFYFYWKWHCDFLGGAVGKNLPANARDTGLMPGPGWSHMPRSKKARAPQLLSLRSRARKPQLLSLQATTTEACMPRAHTPQQEKPPQGEAHTPQWRVAPACCNERKPACSNKDPTLPKIINRIKSLKKNLKKRKWNCGVVFFYLTI